MALIDVTQQVGRMYGSDSNNETNISKAGIWDLLDAISGKDNTKFSVKEAKKELNKRGV